MSLQPGPSSHDPMGQKDALLDHRFRLDEFVGEGPIHKAFTAQDILENRRVCIKVPKPRFRGNQGFNIRYRRDLLEAMLKKNPGWVVPLLVGEHEDTPFQVLPILDGQSICQWYQGDRRNEKALLHAIKSVLSTLGQLSDSFSKIHGALKPSNIFVTSNQELLLTDLVATGRLEDHFADKTQVGLPIYHSPEQLAGERADIRSDIYSLGLVLYETLAQRHPFLEQDERSGVSRSPERLLSSLLDQLRTRPEPPSGFREDVPRWADRFVSHCLHPHPKDRFQSTEAALEWLRHHTEKKAEKSAENRPLPPAGREAEMGYLSSLLSSLADGPEPGCMVRIEGPLGSGKSRCVNWLVDLARTQGVRVVKVENTPESGLHLQSVVNALASNSRSSSKSESEPPESRPVVEPLIEAALEKPILMVLEEVEKADETLTELLRELHTVITDLPVLVLLVTENDEFRTQVTKDFLEEVEHCLKLAPLGRRAIGNLIEERAWAPPSNGILGWVNKVSEGNPLCARLLVEYLQENKFIGEGLELEWTGSPPTERPSLNDLVVRKLDRLSPTSKSILETATGLGDPFNLSTLQAITYHDEDEVDEAIGEAVSVDLLEIYGGRSPTAYRWTHPLFSHTLGRDLPPRRRQRIHRLAAAFYLRGEPEAAKMAYHFLLAGDVPELFYWGALAIEAAKRLGRRGECNYWMNVLLTRVEPSEWVGPDLDRALEEVSRDQSYLLDLQTWCHWFRTLSGREQPKLVGPEQPLWLAQHYFCSTLDWPQWSQEVRELLPKLGESIEKPKTALRYLRAVALLDGEWRRRGKDREPYPGS